MGKKGTNAQKDSNCHINYKAKLFGAWFWYKHLTNMVKTISTVITSVKRRTKFATKDFDHLFREA